jgi:hypothetical protein
MNRVGHNTANGTQVAHRSNRAPATSSSHDPRDPRPKVLDAGVITPPLAGERGHGCTAVLRSQPILTGDGQPEPGYTGAFELICYECGDNPYLYYSEVSLRLQQIRGPYTLAAGVAAYEQHLGLNPCNCRR